MHQSQSFETFRVTASKKRWVYRNQPKYSIRYDLRSLKTLHDDFIHYKKICLKKPSSLIILWMIPEREREDVFVLVMHQWSLANVIYHMRCHHPFHSIIMMESLIFSKIFRLIAFRVMVTLLFLRSHLLPIALFSDHDGFDNDDQTSTINIQSSASEY